MKKAAGVKSGWTTDVGLLVIRLSGIGLALAHGWPKIMRFVSGEGEQFFQGVERMGFPFPVVFGWAAALAELVGGFLIALGLLTRVASFFAAFTMATAAFLRHRIAQQSLALLRSDGNPRGRPRELRRSRASGDLPSDLRCSDSPGGREILARSPLS